MSSSSSQAESLPDPEKYALSLPKDEDSKSSLELSEKERDVEALLPPSNEKPAHKPRKRRSRIYLWMLLNLIASISIVFINKSLLTHTAFLNAQLSLVAFHLALTAVILHFLSLPRFALFQPLRLRMLDVLPISFALCSGIVVTNRSLAYSGIMFYQTARMLLTFATAVTESVVAGKSVPRPGVMTLTISCVGVAFVAIGSYSPEQPDATHASGVSRLGISFALLGVIASAVHQIWRGSFQSQVDVSGLQVLYYQAPLGALSLLYLVPWTDKFAGFRELGKGTCMLALMSGICACAIHISTCVIDAEAEMLGKVVTGHIKMAGIMMLACSIGGNEMVGSRLGMLGMAMAVVGAIGYSRVTLKQERK